MRQTITMRNLAASLMREVRRPWMVHFWWFVALVVVCVTCATLGRRTLDWGVSPLVWQGERTAQFAKISTSLAELETDDIAFSEGLAIDRLRTSFIALASEDDGWRCANYENKTLSNAKVWFDAHPDHKATRELRPFIAEGLRACETRMWPRAASSSAGKA
ncbi:hypothetical protein [Luteibacter sp. dw_328]|uniref:hypothetical protein n=1 Tax=Luteibacter sp. dw_328 TaxID=2719796 RepID=UPI001BD4C6A9|nr:hypothetical protein [Luteibacter sp. dw_328]